MSNDLHTRPTIRAMASVSEQEFARDVAEKFGGSWAHRKPTRRLEAPVAQQMAIALDTAAQRENG